jgi:hypothetical protein
VSGKTREHLKKNPHRQRLGRFITKQRRERGYETAYGFFHKNGGAKYFGFTYAHYLQIEKGLRIPGRKGIVALMPLLLGPGVPERRQELVMLYLKAALDWDPAFDCAFPAQAREGSANDKKPEDQLLSQLLNERVSSAPRMSLEQFQAIASGPDTLWVYNWLHNTGYTETPQQIADALKIPLPKVTGALESLAAHGLLQRKGDAYFSPNFATDLLDPPKIAREQYLWLSEQSLKRSREKGNVAFHAYFNMAAGDEALTERIQSFLREAMMKAYACRPRQSAENASLVGVESRVLLLVPPRERPDRGNAE